LIRGRVGTVVGSWAPGVYEVEFWHHEPVHRAAQRPLSVNFASVRDPSDTYEFRRVIDDIQHAPVTHSNAPLILVAFQLLAARGPGIVGQPKNLQVMRVNNGSSSASNSFCADCLISREYLTTQVNRGGERVSRALRGIARKECLFPFGATPKSDRPGSLPKGPRVFSSRSEHPPCGPSHR